MSQTATRPIFLFFQELHDEVKEGIDEGRVHDIFNEDAKKIKPGQRSQVCGEGYIAAPPYWVPGRLIHGIAVTVAMGTLH